MLLQLVRQSVAAATHMGKEGGQALPEMSRLPAHVTAQ